MHRKFITLIVITATAISFFGAAPARADEDVTKILAGLAAIALIGAAIDRSRDDDRPAQVVHQAPEVGTAYVQPRPLPKKVRNRNLPEQCLRWIPNRGDGLVLLGERCLQAKYRHVSKLPRACKRRVDGRGRGRTGYEPQCLRERGYRLVRK